MTTEHRNRAESADSVIHLHWSTGTQSQILSEFGSESAWKWILLKTHQDGDLSGLSAPK